jgi:hypothetical protein
MNNFLVASGIASCIARKAMGEGIGIDESSHGRQRKRPARRLAEKDHSVKLSLFPAHAGASVHDLACSFCLVLAKLASELQADALA